MTNNEKNIEFSEVTLTEMLDAREKRVQIQAQMQKSNPTPLICFTMNIAGPIKTSPAILRAFEYGIKELKKELKEECIFAEKTDRLKTGPVYYCSVNEKAETIKNICEAIEESCPLGRLFDMDVIGVNGKKLERKTSRCCIVCGAEGRKCAAMRTHSVEELQKTTKALIAKHFAKSDCKTIAFLAQKSLLDEVETTPKPGLVDLANNGSHKDMTPHTFKNSAQALLPYFEECVRLGMETARELSDTTFGKLREAGLEAEKIMYKATNGVNTHKGIIYSMGVILGAIGRLWSVDTPIADINLIFDECAALTKLSVKNDFAHINGTTAGGRLYLLNGEKGIRGEAATGFPSVKNLALPCYKKALRETKDKNNAGVMTLLQLMAKVYDTSIFNRGGEDGVKYAQKYAQKLLSKDNVTTAEIQTMDRDFTEKNLSPGGCADLLAITYFLASLEEIKQ